MADQKTPWNDDQVARFTAQAAQVHAGIARFLATKLDLTNQLRGENLTTVPTLNRPTNYQQRVQVIRGHYDRDPLFQHLIDRTVEYGTTKTKIRAMARKDLRKSIEDLLKEGDEKKGLSDKTRKEQAFWDEWAQSLNMDLDNTIPGIDGLKSTNLKNLLLDGMSTMVMEIGEIEVDGVTYIVPTKVTTMPGAVTILHREIDRKDFIPKESTFVNTSENVDLRNIPATLAQLQKNFPEIKPLREFDPKKFKAESPPTRRQFGFSVKWMHSPSDPNVLGVSQAARGTRGGTLQTHGLYPNPPFTSLQGALLLRQQGQASDLAVLDAVIQQILLVMVGNKDHDIEPDQIDEDGNVSESGTMAQIQNLITADDTEHMMQLILPWYVELKKVETDTSTLISPEKYLHATLTLYAAFGIFIAPPQVREVFEEINRSNFEEILDYAGETLHTGFMRMLVRKIVSWNKPQLSTVPTIFNLPTNTKSADFFQNLDALRTRGEISHQTLLDYLDLNSEYEIHAIVEEIASGKKELIDANVPITLVQTSDGEDGEGGTEKSGGNKSGKQGSNKGKTQPKKSQQSKPSGQRKSGNQVQRRPRAAQK